MVDIGNLIDSMKGISGSGNVLAQLTKLREDFGRFTMEPGDYVRKAGNMAIAAPIGYDLWYTHVHDNFLSHYYPGASGKAGDTYDYTTYLEENLKFLNDALYGLKPLRVIRDLSQMTALTDAMENVLQWTNEGIYWINTMAFELWIKGLSAQYSSGGPKNYAPNDYVGYLTFPVGQLGVMEVISVLRESQLSDYKFHGDVIKTADVAEIMQRPIYTVPPEMFPSRENAGLNYCYGKHLIESGYLIPDMPTLREPAASRDVELFSKDMEKYPEKVQPKLWMRYWLHKDTKWPVPGEFIGILCRPTAVPPHFWWFQESLPFVYAGNWVETDNLTSGVITEVTLEADRTDDGVGNQYKVKIQGCEVIVEASDFLLYSVGDRVGIIRITTTTDRPTKSFTWIDQTLLSRTLKDADEGIEMLDCVIVPITFYKTTV